MKADNDNRPPRTGQTSRHTTLAELPLFASAKEIGGAVLGREGNA